MLSVQPGRRGAKTDLTRELPLVWSSPTPSGRRDLVKEVEEFREFGTSTRKLVTGYKSLSGAPLEIPTYVNEFWTARQRQANSLHEVSYRACFKPQLPRFFIERLTLPGDFVYDPFMGRGTTLLEAALLSRVPFGCDVNPLSTFLVKPRLNPPELREIENRLSSLDLTNASSQPEELLAFYHPQTLKQICSLKEYLLARTSAGKLDSVDEWLRVVALNRLTGHSKGFFSVYTMPPNQAVSLISQKKINAKRNQVPPFRNVPLLVAKKSRQLLRDCDQRTRDTLSTVAKSATLLTSQCSNTPAIPSNSISLVVTSPPFLDVVDYATDNWLRCWFLGLDSKSISLTVAKKLDAWEAAMTLVFRELFRVLKPGGHVAFEVGEIHAGETKLEESVLPCGVKSGLEPLMVFINDQKFTKTANCWGVDNESKGTNTNRIVVFKKPFSAPPAAI